MADRTHSHDTSTPAMSDETVPSEEFVLVPRDRGQTFSNSTLPTEMIAAGMEVLERADDDLAGRNGEDVPDWDYGMEAVAVYRAMIAAAPAPNPSPAAKGGDAVRSHDVLDEAKINALPLPLIARFAGDKDWLPIHDIGVDAPLCRIDVSGKLEPRRFSEIMELKDGDGVIHNPDDFYLDADTPTEGPASQTEGMGGEPEQDYPDMEEHGLDEPLEEALREILLGGQGDDNGAQIMPDFQEGQSVPSMVHACIALLETRRDVIEGYANTEAQLRHRIAALTPPETAEAVEAAETRVMEFLVSRFGGHSVTVVRNGVGRLIGYSLGDDEHDAIAIRDLLDAAGPLHQPSVSDPAPATDDRERLVEALRNAAAPFVRHYADWMNKWPDDREVSVFPRHTYGEIRALRAALATEASR